ncbi:U32 family peptidase [Massilia sp. W12]|uniref:peptidase U32 family protein n=1 Tax=Massilia sp. W12 TaxID=3126507 RepID=UPI0030D15113
MSLAPDQIELLAPARTAEIGREAILHGADAVYIGGPSFGARHNASNSVQEIAGLVEFAHRFHAKIFVTLNTILHEAELAPAQKLVRELYDAGVDALIVQDMAMLELDLPPIQLHASTQCDIRGADKARFLASAGFSQLVLARELTLPQIAAIKSEVKVPLEYFVHGALCVAFSGQCYISHAQTGRSANRGDCSQACRLPYTLSDADGRVLAYEKHLLSMKDNDQSANLEALLDAGVQSLKIEGRYKDMAYVKNITAHYRLLLDEILERRGQWRRASSGRSEIAFTPNVDKTFHRGHTDYFATGRKIDIGAFDSPKFVGLHLGYAGKVGADSLEIETDETLANGDGLNYMHKREVVGLALNKVQQLRPGLWQVWPNERMSDLPGLKSGIAVNRNRDHRFDQALTKKSAERRMGLRMRLRDLPQESALLLELQDEDGILSQTRMTLDLQAAEQAEKARKSLSDSIAKLGNTHYRADAVELALSGAWFVPAAQVNALRRAAIEAHDAARMAAYVRPLRAYEQEVMPYPETSLSYLANVYNSLARKFYERHGVQVIAAAYEAHEEEGEVSLMITKHCLRFAFNLCPKQAKGVIGVQGQVKAEPLTLVNGNEKLTLKFECKPCEMHVMGKIKKNILQSAPPSSVPYSPLKFYKSRPKA